MARAIRPIAKDSNNGELAGGMVMSLMTRRDNSTVIAVACSISATP